MKQSTELLLKTLGLRIKQARINKNFTQNEVADIIGKSRTAIEGAEKGKCTLETFVSILEALDLIDSIDLFLPEQPLSPIALAKAQGNIRKRATGHKAKVTHNKDEDDLEW